MSPKYTAQADRKQNPIFYRGFWLVEPAHKTFTAVTDPQFQGWETQENQDRYEKLATDYCTNPQSVMQNLTAEDYRNKGFETIVVDEKGKQMPALYDPWCDITHVKAQNLTNLKNHLRVKHARTYWLFACPLMKDFRRRTLTCDCQKWHAWRGLKLHLEQHYNNAKAHLPESGVDHFSDWIRGLTFDHMACFTNPIPEDVVTDDDVLRDLGILYPWQVLVDAALIRVNFRQRKSEMSENWANRTRCRILTKRMTLEDIMTSPPPEIVEPVIIRQDSGLAAASMDIDMTEIPEHSTLRSTTPPILFSLAADSELSPRGTSGATAVVLDRPINVDLDRQEAIVPKLTTEKLTIALSRTGTKQIKTSKVLPVPQGLPQQVMIVPVNGSKQAIAMQITQVSPGRSMIIPPGGPQYLPPSPPRPKRLNTNVVSPAGRGSGVITVPPAPQRPGAQLSLGEHQLMLSPRPGNSENIVQMPSRTAETAVSSAESCQKTKDDLLEVVESQIKMQFALPAMTYDRVKDQLPAGLQPETYVRVSLNPMERTSEVKVNYQEGSLVGNVLKIECNRQPTVGPRKQQQEYHMGIQFLMNELEKSRNIEVQNKVNAERRKTAVAKYQKTHILTEMTQATDKMTDSLGRHERVLQYHQRASPEEVRLEGPLGNVAQLCPIPVAPSGSRTAVRESPKNEVYANLQQQVEMESATVERYAARIEEVDRTPLSVATTEKLLDRALRRLDEAEKQLAEFRRQEEDL